MSNILKKILTTLNVLLLVIAFFLILYINVYQCFYLKNNPFGRGFFDFFAILVPFVLLMSLYFINFINSHNIANNSLLYKVIAIISMITIIYISYRAIFDDSLILWHKTDYHINFEYFNNHVIVIKIILYGLGLVNIFFIIEEYLQKNKVKN